MGDSLDAKYHLCVIWHLAFFRMEAFWQIQSLNFWNLPRLLFGRSRLDKLSTSAGGFQSTGCYLTAAHIYISLVLLHWFLQWLLNQEFGLQVICLSQYRLASVGFLVTLISTVTVLACRYTVCAHQLDLIGILNFFLLSRINWFIKKWLQNNINDCLMATSFIRLAYFLSSLCSCRPTLLSDYSL